VRGEFSGIREEIIAEIFDPLAAIEDADGSLALDLFRDTIPKPKPPKEPTATDLNEDGNIYLPGDIEAFEEYRIEFAEFQEELEAYTDASSRPDLAWEQFKGFYLDVENSEPELVRAIEKAFDVLEEFGGDEASNSFFNSFNDFLEKYSLRYDLRRPFSLHPTLPGIFANLMRDIRNLTQHDAALAGLMHDFEEAFRDLKFDKSDRRMRQCMEAQFKLLEAIAQGYPGIAPDSLGRMCHHLPTWPHPTMRAAIGNLYGFASNYPGIRHAGNPASKLRDIEMRDMVAVAVILAGFSPYLTDQLVPDTIFLE
jgi:hypothetical protein